MSSQPLDRNGPAYFFGDEGFYPVARPQFPPSPLPYHPSQLPGAVASHQPGPFYPPPPPPLEPFPSQYFSSQYERRYENIHPGQPPPIPLREMFSITDDFIDDGGSTGLPVPQSESSDSFLSPPTSAERFRSRVDQSSQVNPTAVIPPHASTQAPLGFGQSVIQSSQSSHKGKATPSKPKEDDPKDQADEIPPKRILPFPNPKKRKAQVAQPEEPRRTKIIFTKPPSATVATTAPQDKQKSARASTSLRKRGGKARAPVPQTRGSSNQKPSDKNSPSFQPSSDLVDHDISHTPLSHRTSQQNDTSGPPPLPIQDMSDFLSFGRRDTAKYPTHKRSMSQGTTVSGTSTTRSIGTATKGSVPGAKAKDSPKPRIKIDEAMVLKTSMRDLVNARLRQGNVNALRLLRGEDCN
ncbi:hypothetical protein NPX13_g5576 [Xylaria arbuscula]|uniref:Uncharacterized protein n=1 Tax=Xylaria arbuscula TaxID=114810 RepID=A0A9W8NDF7_9PEZI|nr:hypothetical protein NPX13_g5576 [Xylaria arbuscula]